MNTRFCVSVLVLVSLQFSTVSRAEAGLGDIWNTVVGWFTGGKKQDAGEASQIQAMLEQSNTTQNQLIAAINDVLETQKGLTNLNNPEDQKKLDAKMQTMKAMVEQNNQSYNLLLQAKDQLVQQNKFAPYESTVSQFVNKQKEIEGYYPKIEDRYNELKAFSKPAEATQAQTQVLTRSAVSAEPWKDATVRAKIDAYLAANNRDQWGWPNTPGVTQVSIPQAAANKDRYQYLWDTWPEFHALANGAEVVADTSKALMNPSAPVSAGVAQTVAPAAPVSEVSVALPSNPQMGIAPINRHDNAALREKRDAVYATLMKMQAEGKMGTEEYKDTYSQYVALSDQMK